MIQVKENLYKGDRKIVVEPSKNIGSYYIADTSNFIPGKTYTFSCKMKQIPGIDKQATNSVHIAQGHNKRFKTHGGYYIKDISDGILEFTFNYISEANSILCYTALTNSSINMGAEWSNIEIVEGESKNPIFVPSESTLPEDKKPLLPPEGHYKEIQAI